MLGAKTPILGCAEEFGPCGVNRAVVPVAGRWLLGLCVPRAWLLSLVRGGGDVCPAAGGDAAKEPRLRVLGVFAWVFTPGQGPCASEPPLCCAWSGVRKPNRPVLGCGSGPPAAGHLSAQVPACPGVEALVRRWLALPWDLAVGTVGTNDLPWR